MYFICFGLDLINNMRSNVLFMHQEQQQKQHHQQLHKRGYFSTKKAYNAEVLELKKSLMWKANKVMID